MSNRYLRTALELTRSLRVMSILLPTAFFSALDRGITGSDPTALLTDELRTHLLRFSRGTAVILLVMYV